MIKKLLCALLTVSLLLLPSCKKIEETPNDTSPIDSTTIESTAPETKVPETTVVETAPETTQPETTIPDTTVPETTVPETTVPVTTPQTEPVVVPPANPNKYIGTKYTIGQLSAMDATKKGYGQGLNVDENNRPTGAIYAQNTYGAYNTAFIAPLSNKICLTFDLGYENGYTSKILDVLKEKNVKAIFFATMSYCKSNPAIVQRIIDEGHVLGNHSVRHYSMPTLSFETMEYEIMELHNYILNNYGYTMTLFRPPMGEFSVQSLAVTESLGYKTVHWSFAYLDYDTANQPEYNAALERVTGAVHGGAIYLLHAVSKTNTEILPAVIDDFISKGYTISTEI